MTRLNNSLAFPFARAMACGAVVLALMAAPATARDADGDARPYAVTVHNLDLHPNSPAAARRILERLGEAALEACGGSPFSLREIKLAIRASACWKSAMAGALAQIRDPLLAQTYANGARRNG